MIEHRRKPRHERHSGIGRKRATSDGKVRRASDIVQTRRGKWFFSNDDPQGDSIQDAQGDNNDPPDAA